MTHEEKVKFLKSYQRAKQRAIAYTNEIRDLELSMLPQGQHISDMPKRGGSTDPMGDFGGEFWEIYVKLQRTQKKMLHVIAVVNQLAETDPVGHRLLTEQYIRGRALKEIEWIMKMSPNTRRKYHNIAVGELKL